MSASVAHAQDSTASERQQQAINQAIKDFGITVGLAESACLSNVKTAKDAGLVLDLKALVSGVKASVGLEQQVTKLRGASEQLSGEVAKLENDEIRKCMNSVLAPAFGRMQQAYSAADPGAAWPEPIDFRFHYARVISKDPDKFSENLKINLLRKSREPVTRRITYQYDQGGSTYYQVDIPYPSDGEIIKGTIAPEIKGQARLTTELPTFTPLCLRRPPSFPQVKADYDLFECTEGGQCRTGVISTGWLTACSNADSGERIPASPALPIRHAAFRFAALDGGAVERRWVVPSLQSLTERNSEGVGYTIFTLSTEAFRGREVLGVEVNVRVNGTRVDEDGLPPEMRPIANDPERPFTHSFALQSLDFQGGQGGCDEIKVGLTPVYKGGGKGEQRDAILSYAALRDVEERQTRLGDGQLIWRASYITPEREWRHYPIVHSYAYSVKDANQAAAVASAAEDDKRWLDQQGFSYKGQRVVGVVRPPRTIQPNGTAAFGLAVGLLQETGQIRFTFPEADARSIADFMIAQRGRDGADRVIEPERFIFQAIGGYRTVKGVCGTF